MRDMMVVFLAEAAHWYCINLVDRFGFGRDFYFWLMETSVELDKNNIYW